MSQLFQIGQSMGVVRFALRKRAVFRGRFRRRNMSISPTHARHTGLWHILRAEYAATRNRAANCLGLGEWLSWRARVERMPFGATTVELVPGGEIGRSASTRIDTVARASRELAQP